MLMEERHNVCDGRPHIPSMRYRSSRNLRLAGIKSDDRKSSPITRSMSLSALPSVTSFGEEKLRPYSRLTRSGKSKHRISGLPSGTSAPKRSIGCSLTGCLSFGQAESALASKPSSHVGNDGGESRRNRSSKFSHIPITICGSNPQSSPLTFYGLPPGSQKRQASVSEVSLHSPAAIAAMQVRNMDVGFDEVKQMGFGVAGGGDLRGGSTSSTANQSKRVKESRSQRHKRVGVAVGVAAVFRVVVIYQ